MQHKAVVIYLTSQNQTILNTLSVVMRLPAIHTDIIKVVTNMTINAIVTTGGQ